MTICSVPAEKSFGYPWYFYGKAFNNWEVILTAFFSPGLLFTSPLFTYEKNWVRGGRDLPDNEAGVLTPGTDLGWGLDGKDH